LKNTKTPFEMLGEGRMISLFSAGIYTRYVEKMNS